MGVSYYGILFFGFEAEYGKRKVEVDRFNEKTGEKYQKMIEEVYYTIKGTEIEIPKPKSDDYDGDNYYSDASLHNYANNLQAVGVEYSRISVEYEETEELYMSVYSAKCRVDFLELVGREFGQEFAEISLPHAKFRLIGSAS